MFNSIVTKVCRNHKSVALVCLAFNPQLYYRKIMHALWQIYPHKLKTLILLYQPDKITGKFPIPIVNDLPFDVLQENVDAQWPEAWAWKWKRAVDICVERKIEYMVVFDEDDEYPPWWIEQMIDLIVKNKVDGAWSWFNMDVKRGKVLGYGYPQPYDAPSGAMVMSTRLMKYAIDRLFAKWPSGKRNEGATGTGDMTVSKFIMDEGKILAVKFMHENNRGYVRYGLANTNRRNPEDDIDFGFMYGDHLTVKVRCDEDDRVNKIHRKKVNQVKPGIKIPSITRVRHGRQIRRR